MLYFDFDKIDKNYIMSRLPARCPHTDPCFVPLRGQRLLLHNFYKKLYYLHYKYYLLHFYALMYKVTLFTFIIVTNMEGIMYRTVLVNVRIGTFYTEVRAFLVTYTTSEFPRLSIYFHK